MKAKIVLRWDRTRNTFRLFRVLWTRGVVGSGSGYSAKLSFALKPSLFHACFRFNDYLVTLFGLRIHYRRSYGGMQQ